MSKAEGFSPFDYGFDMAFGTGAYLDPTIGNYQASYVDWKIVNSTVDKDGGLTIKKLKFPEDIPFSRCNSSNFNYYNWTEAIYNGFGSFMCLNLKNASLKGNYFS